MNKKTNNPAKAIILSTFGLFMIGMAALWIIYLLPEQSKSQELVQTGEGVFVTQMQYGMYYIIILTVAGGLSLVFGIINLIRLIK